MVEKCPRSMINVSISAAARWRRWIDLVKAHRYGLINNRSMGAHRAIFIRQAGLAASIERAFARFCVRRIMERFVPLRFGVPFVALRITSKPGSCFLSGDSFDPPQKPCERLNCAPNWRIYAAASD